MGLVYKKLEKIGRSMYLYFPEQERRTAFKRCSITNYVMEKTKHPYGIF